MDIDFNALINSMTLAIKEVITENITNAKEYSGDIDDEIFGQEVKREKIIETELLTRQIISKAAAKKAAMVFLLLLYAQPYRHTNQILV